MRDRLSEGLRGLGLTKREVDQLLDVYRDGLGLDNASTAALEQVLSPAKARRVKAAFAVTRACDEACMARLPSSPMRTPSDVVAAVRSSIGDKPQEYFVVVLLDARNRIIDLMGVAVGTLASVDVHPRDLFREAIRRGAHTIVMAHNHPSGSVDPSAADVELTERMVEVGKKLGIPVLDHVIVTRDGHVSLRAVGIWPS